MLVVPGCDRIRKKSLVMVCLSTWFVFSSSVSRRLSRSAAVVRFLLLLLRALAVFSPSVAVDACKISVSFRVSLFSTDSTVSIFLLCVWCVCTQDVHTIVHDS